MKKKMKNNKMKKRKPKTIQETQGDSEVRRQTTRAAISKTNAEKEKRTRLPPIILGNDKGWNRVSK